MPRRLLGAVSHRGPCCSSCARGERRRNKPSVYVYAEQRRKSQLEVGGVGLATISSRRHPTVGRAREVVLRIYRRIPRGAGGPAHKTLVYSSYAPSYLKHRSAFSVGAILAPLVAGPMQGGTVRWWA